MVRPFRRKLAALFLAWFYGCLIGPAYAAEDRTVDPLPSWYEGASKRAIIDFVQRVTLPSGKDFVPVPERIAVFDNDGTLWAEQPIYTQLRFVLDRVKAIAPRFPNWRTKQPFKAAIEDDFQTLAGTGTEGLLKLVMATSAGMTTDAYEKLVANWLATARDRRFHRPFTDLVYQPMIELLTYLRSNGFKTWIASGGGSDFLRPWTERVYGIPPEQVIGSSLKTKLEFFEGKPVLVRLPEIGFIDNHLNKPVGINEHIGRRPVLAIGNSDGDLAMLQWTVAGPGPRLAMLVHHTDAQREWAYDRKSRVGHLNVALDFARKQGWPLVDMRRDWKRIFPFER